MADKSERDRLVQLLMDHSGLTRSEAEAAAAIELGEVHGDLVELPPDADPNAPD